DTNLQVGSGGDVAIAWNNTDSLISLNTAGTASANTDYGIYTFAADTGNTGMTANQEIFEIGKGGADDSVANYVELLALDEDGDLTILGWFSAANGNVVVPNAGVISSGTIAWTQIKSQPTILSSLDGVSNDEANIDLVAGSNINITPDDGANTITI